MFEPHEGGNPAVPAGPLCLLLLCSPGSPPLPSVSGGDPGPGRQHGEHRQGSLQHNIVHSREMLRSFYCKINLMVN